MEFTLAQPLPRLHEEDPNLVGRLEWAGMNMDAALWLRHAPQVSLLRITPRDVPSTVWTKGRYGDIAVQQDERGMFGVWKFGDDIVDLEIDVRQATRLDPDEYTARASVYAKARLSKRKFRS